MPGEDPLRPAEPFWRAAEQAVGRAQLRANVRRATTTIRAKRKEVVGELPDWQALRASGHVSKDRALADLGFYLTQLEEQVELHGGQVHWARDAQEACDVVTRLIREAGARRVMKVKSLTTEEIALNEHLAQAGIEAVETDLAELIVQLAGERPSHILVPAIHKNRAEIRALFAHKMGLPDLTDDPPALAEAARQYLRETFLTTQVAVSGANFAVAETGSLVIVESEGNGRMCLTLPQVLISVVGIEKVIPTWQDLEVFLQLLPRSATGERMNPYTSVIRGVHPGDGPQAFHLVLLDNGRTRTLADPQARSALRCIRCSACLNVCPVYERVGGHAYGSVYPGPIGAVITPYLTDAAEADSLPFASTLCGACAEVCPVEIPLPEHLLRLRSRAVARTEGTLAGRLRPETLAMRAVARVLADPARFAQAAALPHAFGKPTVEAAALRLRFLGLAGWSEIRDWPDPPPESFRAWWLRTHGPQGQPTRQARGGSALPRLRRRRPSPAVQVMHGPPHPAPQAQAPSEARDARNAILAAVRAAPPDPSLPPTPRAYRVQDEVPREERLARLVARLSDYGAGVEQVATPDAVGDAVARVLSRHGAVRVAIPADLPAAYVTGVIEPYLDAAGTPLDLRLVAGLDAVVTTCRLAIAETGTIVLDGGAGQGRRVLSLLPDLHVCLVAESAVVADVPSAVRALAHVARGTSQPLTWISGPSATADIEFRRVQGVHGPRRLEVLLLPV